MPDDAKPKTEQLSGCEIVRDVDYFRQALWPRWKRERMLTSFYNAEKTYVENEADDEDIPETFGLGNRFIRKPFEQLQDAILMKPGFLKATLRYPLEPQRKRMVEVAFDEEVNAIVHHRTENLIKGLAGRALITGKSFAYRLSRWDWLFKQGRLLHDWQAPNDIYDDSFREWAFTGSMTLRDIDSYIESTRNYDGKGWSKTGLQELKKWILETTDVEKQNSGTTSSITTTNFMEPFNDEMCRRRLDVYWFFRKNGTRNPFGQERIDIYCVTRWMTTAGVTSTPRDGYISKTLQIEGSDNGRQQTIYYLPDAFESIDECLIPCQLDERIDGEQTMIAMEGLGRMMVNRVLPMEHLTGALVSGLAWATQPNFQAQSGADQAQMERIAKEGGVAPWDGIPSGMKMLDKQNALTGISGAMNVLQMLGMSADQDAATGEISAFSANTPELKSLADKWVQQVDQAVGRRKEKFFGALDRMASQMTELFGRPFTQWRKGDPAYYEVLKVQLMLIKVHQISPAEFSSERLVGECRRLAGNADKAQTIQGNMAFAQAYGGQIAPTGLRWLAKESGRAAYGDPIADQILFPDEPPVAIDQQVMATAQESMCLVSLQIPQRNPQDNPVIHSIHHLQAIAMQVQVAQQAGSWTPRERLGVQNLLQHLAQDVPGMPQGQLQDMVHAAEQIARVVASIPVSGQMSETQLKEQDAQRKNQELMLKVEKEHNIVDERKAKHADAQQKLFLQMQNADQQAKSAGVDRAKKLQEMATPPEPAAV